MVYRRLLLILITARGKEGIKAIFFSTLTNYLGSVMNFFLKEATFLYELLIKIHGL